MISQVVFTMEDNILTQHQLGDKETFTTYKFTEKELHVVSTYICNYHVSNFYYFSTQN
jgi:hypothetical protein